ncbi:BTB/POZ and MATH domain-containing protein 2-like [Lolium rigidum]|uniref:BTB/POZ and MATH domain-containing protein 2-like n=1 Tax=Lolium rigidum TaxID=89674 RepID=UPI001F5CD062|nr:BTB/POZ and MATH domain-containing protein 2-like [Lolium rigidum]
MPNGEKIRSDEFRVGGHDWRLECYPNGLTGNRGFVSLYLTHASHAKTGDATARLQFSILDQSCWEPSCTKFSDDYYRFSDTHGPHLSWGFGNFIEHEDLDKEKHLKDDRLMIMCDVTVAGLRADDDDDHAVAEVEPASPPFDLHGPDGQAIWNTEKPDLEIEAGGETFPVHRRVLEARSPVFKADLSLAGGAAKLRIDDMDADVCKALLRFFYDEIPGTELLENAGMAERLLIAANRYKVEKLKHICEKALLPSVSLSSVADTLALAERHHCPELREACVRFLSSRDNIVALAETDGFEKMKKDCPSALLELLVK